MKTFLKALLTLTLATAFVFSGCNTTDVSSEISSYISNVPSSVSEDSSYEESLDTSSVQDSSADISSAAPSDYTNVADVPDEIWQKIIDSQFTKDLPGSPFSQQYSTWEKLIEDIKPFTYDVVGREVVLSADCVLVPQSIYFDTRNERDELLTKIKENSSLLSLAETSNPIYIFNDDCSKVARVLYQSIFPQLSYIDMMYDVQFPSVYKYRWTWFEFSLNDNRKKSLMESQLDLSKTIATQITISGFGYGFLLSDGEHEYFMRTNDYDMFDYKNVPTVISEYEKLYSYGEIVSMLTEYDCFDENGNVIWDSTGGYFIHQLNYN